MRTNNEHLAVIFSIIIVGTSFLTFAVAVVLAVQLSGAAEIIFVAIIAGLCVASTSAILHKYLANRGMFVKPALEKAEDLPSTVDLTNLDKSISDFLDDCNAFTRKKVLDEASEIALKRGRSNITPYEIAVAIRKVEARWVGD